MLHNSENAVAGILDHVRPWNQKWEVQAVESLSNDDGDVNENGKKAKSLDWQNNNFARASRSVCTFLCCHCTYRT